MGFIIQRPIIKVVDASDFHVIALTNKAFDIVVKRELMREWSLVFTVLNSDGISNSLGMGIFLFENEIYNMVLENVNIGTENTTTVKCEHMSYSLNKWSVQSNFTATGTITQIFNAAFSASGIPFSWQYYFDNYANELNFTFTYTGSQPISLRALLYKIAAQRYFEINFSYTTTARTIICKEQIGNKTNSGDKLTPALFTLGRNLLSANLQSDYSQNPIAESYNFDIVNLQRTDSYISTDVFDLGLEVDYHSNGIDQSGLRITTYEYHYDDPLQDKIGIGSFIPDLSDSKTTGGGI